jgi:hypothetical protein
MPQTKNLRTKFQIRVGKWLAVMKAIAYNNATLITSVKKIYTSGIRMNTLNLSVQTMMFQIRLGKKWLALYLTTLQN